MFAKTFRHFKVRFNCSETFLGQRLKRWDWFHIKSCFILCRTLTGLILKMQKSKAALKISFYFGYRGQRGMLCAAAASSRNGGPHKTAHPKSSGSQNKRSPSAVTCSVCIFLLLLTSPLAKSDLNPFYSWTDFSLWAIILFTGKWGRRRE